MKKKKIMNKSIILSHVKKKIKEEVKNTFKDNFRMISYPIFKSIFLKKKIFKYYKKIGFYMSVYDLLRTCNKNKILSKRTFNYFQKYLKSSLYKRNTHLIYKLYKFNTSIPNPILIKKQFNIFLTKNNLYQIFNLKRNLPYPNYLQSKPERAVVFRDLVNKEAGYYKAVKRHPLVILVSPKPKNIYITIYTLSTNGYKILWKKTTGMLEKVEGELSLAALIEIFNKINIFLTKNYLKLKQPLKLIIKSSKYFATTNIIQNFVKMFQNNIKLNYIYFMYKYRKRFNFFSNYANLINDSLFNYLSGIWIKFLKLIKKTKLSMKYIFIRKNLEAYNKFFGLEFDYAKRRYTINHFTRLRRIKSLQNRI